MSRALFSFLAVIALMLCTAGVVRYDRNEIEHPILPKPARVTHQASDVDTIEGNFLTNLDEALELSRQKRKPILLLVTAQNCLFSRQLRNVTFRSEAVRPFLERFVLVDIDLGTNADLCKQLSVESTPTIQFMSPQGVPLQRLNGATEPEDLATQMSATLQTIASRNQPRIR